MGPLVTTEWLAAELGKPDLVVFDATKYLPNEDKDGHAEFLRAHIPGARYFDIDEVADPDTDLPHMVPTPGRFAKLIGATGRRQCDARRVLRPEGPGLGGARLVADGPVRPRQGRGARWRPAEMDRAKVAGPKTGEPAPPQPVAFRPDYRAARLRGIGDVLGNVATRAELVLDARAGGPLHRRGAGAARGHAQRPHPGFGQPALHRSAERRRHVPFTPTRCARAWRRPASMDRARW